MMIDPMMASQLQAWVTGRPRAETEVVNMRCWAGFRWESQHFYFDYVKLEVLWDIWLRREQTVGITDLELKRLSGIRDWD